MFYKHVGTLLIIVLVHVDDCTIVATVLPLINDFKANLVNHIEITNLGDKGCNGSHLNSCNNLLLSMILYLEQGLIKDH